MTTLQSEVINSLEGLSNDNLQLLLDIINKVMKPKNKTNSQLDKKKAINDLYCAIPNSTNKSYDELKWEALKNRYEITDWYKYDIRFFTLSSK